MDQENNLWQRYKSLSSNNLGECPNQMEMSALAEGKLGGRKSQKIHMHLSSCDDCLDIYITLKRQLEAKKQSDDCYEIDRVFGNYSDWFFQGMFRWVIPALVASSIIFCSVKAGIQTFRTQEYALNAICSAMAFDVDPITFLLGI